MHTEHAVSAHDEHVPHVLPLSRYLGVWGALLVLTGATVGVSYLDFGTWNVVIALLVATTKALLVASVFMHLAYEKQKFNAVVFLSSAVFLATLMALTMIDTKSRGLNEEIEGARPKVVTQPFVNGVADIVGKPPAVAPAPADAKAAVPASAQSPAAQAPTAPAPAAPAPAVPPAPAAPAK